MNALCDTPMSPTTDLSPSTPSPTRDLPLAKGRNRAGDVQALFDRIAGHYDGLNQCISLGFHHGWKQKTVEALALRPGDTVADICTGTGDLAQHLLPRIGPQGRVIGVDFSREMLHHAEKRFANVPNVQWHQGDALDLPLADNSVDASLICFGLRNVEDIPKALAEMVRITRPGGRIAVLDTIPNPPLPGYRFYFGTLMPLMGALFANDRAAYTYLFTSTQAFDPPELLAQHCQTLALADIQVERLMLGSVVLLVAQKPL